MAEWGYHRAASVLGRGHRRGPAKATAGCLSPQCSAFLLTAGMAERLSKASTHALFVPSHIRQIVTNWSFKN